MPVNPDPQNTPRQRRFDQTVAAVINDLERSGALTLGPDGWEVAGGLTLASPSGLELVGADSDQLRIDLDTAILQIVTAGLGFAVQNANKVLAGPTTGADATPTFRALVTADIANDLVTYAKIQNVSAASRLLGRGSASGAGDVEEISLGSNLSLTGTTLSAVGGGSGGNAGGLDAISSVYPLFTAGANDDEFDDGTFTGWTAVNSGTNVPTVTETNNVASVYLPGGNSPAELAAYVKAVTPSAGQYVEGAFRGQGKAGAYNICGLVMADGSTYGAGNQVIWYYSPQEGKWALSTHTNYNVQGTFGPQDAQLDGAYGDMFMRLEYDAANTFRGWVSPDGVSWVDATGAVSYTLSPTRVGFFVTTWGSSTPFVWSWRYFKFV